MIHSVINVPVLKTGTNYTLSSDEREFIYEDIPYKFTQANNNFLSEDYRILDSGKLDGVKSVIERAIEDYRVNVCGIEQKLVITQSWVARTLVGGAHSMHAHPNSIFSGVYYISCSDKSPLNFYHGNQLFKEFNFDLNYTHATPYNMGITSLDIDVGDVVIFPSWINHDVAVNPGPDERVVLAFNTFISGELGIGNFYPTGLTVRTS